MKRRGRPPAATARERERVLALAEEGFSQRAIAERVFGDRMLRGRVERILQRDRSREASLDAEVASLVDRLETLARELEQADLPPLEELVLGYKKRSLAQRLETAPESVRARELTALFNLELRLEQKRQFERARELTSG
jgi:FixJ family two-component response regulator